MAISSMKTKVISSKVLAGNSTYNPSLPTSISGLKVWLDSSDTATITLAGSDVSQWNDKSSNSYTFTQGTSARRPVSGTASQNGKNVMVYSTNDCLQSTAAASTWTFFSDGSPYTIFMSGKTTSSTTQQILLSTYSGSGFSVGFQNALTSTNLVNHSVLRNVSGATTLTNETTTTFGTNFSHWTTIGDPANGTAANRSDIRIGKGSAQKNNTSTNSPNTGTPYQSLLVGDYIQGGGIGWIGQIGEIIIYDSILSAGNIANVQDYLIAKWGI